MTDRGVRLTAILVLVVAVIHGQRTRYDSHEVWRLTPKTRAQLDFLAELRNSAQKYQLDFWKEPSAVQRLVVLRVPPKRRNEMYLRFGLQGLDPEVTIEDLQKAIDSENIFATQTSCDTLLGFDYSKYHPLPEINLWMEQISASYPDRVHMFDISRSYEGRVIRALKIVGKGNNSTKPGFFFDGGIHAREWISPATVIYMAAQLIEKYDKDPTITAMVDAFDFYVLPVFNVDGYNYTWTTDRLWRKTRSKHSSSTCIGVDPNRNWDFHWCENGASKDPCSESYCGPSPFSEVEVKGVADFLNSVPGRFRAYIDFHSFSQLWMTPWGYTKTLPPDYAAQEKCSMVAVSALTAVHGTKYKYGPLAIVIYISSGSSADWTYGVAKIKYSTGVELRDTGTYGFLLPAYEIIPSGEETLQGVLAMAQFILNNP